MDKRVWVFTVTWCIMIAVPMNRYIHYDEFGRQVMEVYPVEQYIQDYDCGHNKQFLQSKEAREFYLRAIKESSNGEFIPGKLYDVRIDSAEYSEYIIPPEIDDKINLNPFWKKPIYLTNPENQINVNPSWRKTVFILDSIGINSFHR